VVTQTSQAIQAATAAAKPPTPTLAVVKTLETLPDDMPGILEVLGGYPCPDSEFTCVNITVPLDHANPQDGRTTQVVFAVLPASGERKGMLVVANGGPGVSGVLSADSYLPYYDASIAEHFDIVFFDQRGVNLSGGLQCPYAAAEFYRADWDASTPTGEELLLDSAEKFAADCVEEMGDPEILPYLGTQQAIEDLEIFRLRTGQEQIWLYGESYGTQFAQTYAATYPERLAGLILDGVVDLTLSGAQFLDGQARAFNQVLEETLQACNQDEACAAAMGEDALVVYDRLAAQLKASPQAFDFPLPSGGLARRMMTFSDLEAAAAGYLYSETQRMVYLRALAAYAWDGDLVPMARILYDALVLDPETERAILDPSYSDAVYYAVECQDYAYFNGTQAERAMAYLDAGDGLDASLPRFASIFYGDLPCIFWPDARQDETRPEPLVAEGVPTLVLNGTSDPATPYANATAVESRLDDGYLVTMSGGPHIIYAWGHACVDDLVTRFLVEGEPPPANSTQCEGAVADAFVPLAPRSAAGFEDPLQALASVDDEIYFLPEYYFWDTETPTDVGCPRGGTLSFEATEDGEGFTLQDCAFSEGFAMTGSGAYRYDDGLFSLDVAVSGLAEGQLIYTRDWDWNQHVSGEYNGQPVDLPREGDVIG
jgi:pimeloyl-ACP methyl ester carboxylesterase